MEINRTNLVDHAERELDELGMFDDNSDYGGRLGSCTMELIQVFTEQRHSGASASTVISMFNKLAQFEPLTPLTYKDNEWVKHSPDLWQNNRDPRVFTEDQGVTWYSNDGTSGRCE